MQSVLPRGSKVAESQGYVTVVVDVKGNTYEVARAEYEEFLQFRARKRNRGLSEDERLTARVRYDDTLKRRVLRVTPMNTSDSCTPDAERPRIYRRKQPKKGITGSESGAPTNSSENAPPPEPRPVAKLPKPRCQRGVIVSSRPGFHTIIVDSSGGTLEVTKDDYRKWLLLHEAKTDVELSMDARLANRTRAKHIMDNWGRKGKQKKKPGVPQVSLSRMSQPETEEECYQAAMLLLGSAYIT
ncbi:hypothetical protein RhiLY_12623 [Ceratobasidium sp. AG-Ba]|nr:hypothetical protein RhiLY_12623 [Ceratobasidium sp. AG-Ba]